MSDYSAKLLTLSECQWTGEVALRRFIMTDIERVKDAKDCMDRLAEGVDPTSGEILLDDTVLNNVDLSGGFI